ncbi:MAG: hypothetical protein ACRDLF_14425 [Solirubrobacteraceae bacterium]
MNDTLQTARDIAPLLQGGGNVALILLVFVAYSYYRRLERKLDRVALRFEKFLVAWKIQQAAPFQQALGDTDDDTIDQLLGGGPRGRSRSDR